MPETILPVPIPPATTVPRILHCNGVFFEEMIHPEAFRMTRHSHDEAHMAFVRAGNIENFEGNRTHAVSRSALLFMPPGETHSTQYGDNVHAFYIVFSAAWWERVAKSMPVFEEACTYQDSPPARIASRLYHEFQKRDALTPLQLEGLTLELLVAMSRDRSSFQERGVPKWLPQAREYLHAHSRTQTISIHAVADAVGVHPGHLMRGFRQQYHCTVGEYVRGLRVQTACDWMRHSDRSLLEIALSLGFSDQSHFCKSFKAVTGMTPTEWQNHFG